MAEQHGDGRRDFYFVTEDAAGFERIAHTAAGAFAFRSRSSITASPSWRRSSFRRRRLANSAWTSRPTLGIRATRFEFWGAEPSLERLRAELERRGYRFLSLEMSTRELRMFKHVPIDGPGFRGVLKEIVPLARSLGCSYRGTETVEGFEQFALTRPLPERYAADPSTGAGIVRRVFGRRGL